MSIPASKLDPISGRRHASRLFFTVCFFAFGCGAPGEPSAPMPPIPVAITDLVAEQAGDGVQLVLTIPGKSMAGDRLAATPAVEIYRGSLNSQGAPEVKSFHNVYTIPGALVANYLSDGHLQFTDPLDPAETKAHPGATLAYVVRTRASEKRASADSNLVTVRVFPVPERVAPLEARVSETAIELTWPAPAHTSSGDILNFAPTYHLYRGELAPDSVDVAAPDLAQAKWKTKPTLLASADSQQYSDTAFDFGKTYVYTVRSVQSVGNQPLESDDSPAITVSPRDVFPPTAPENVSAAAIPGPAPGTLEVDLSWSINLESDLAGYRVYKSEDQGTRGPLLNSELLLTPALRDTSVQPGHRYWYTVTAVDRAGNESAASSPGAVDLAQPTP